ncbi:hypothetical protein BHYA_0135g00010 [Botrytis hyacinthi]|uniref:Uncharacterized protein n=1 Tax=Botrytis hyacinthi TaxID=278943 RepID=A0A4Z1GGT3_9HELO|nr:hypothetical protein BHYA_0135g00010 [Botrytis hyacinthi]
MSPHHWLLGHIPLSASIIGSLPPYAHGVYFGDQIRQSYPHLDSAFYLDNWPLAAPILVVLKTDMMYQLTQANQIPKTKAFPLTGESDLVALEGCTWKYWRAIFNPGFSASHVSSLVPGMIEEIKVFKDLLRKYAKSGKIMFLEDASLNLTIDIIGRVAMDYRFCSQTSYNDMTAALRRQFIKCTEIQKKDKSIVDLALKAYLAENPSASGIDKSFQNFAMAQIKLFILAGHDTTSAVCNCFQATTLELAYLYHCGHQIESPHLPRCRRASRWTILFLFDRRQWSSFPTERTIVWGDHYATHHNPAHWPRAEEFLPERWIVTKGHELYPPKNGWRPFERGPRNCIGQEVAMTEIKLMLALTIRDFDFKDAYEEYDVMKGNPKGLNVNGQRAYMMLWGGGDPADHYPSKVAFAKQK